MKQKRQAVKEGGLIFTLKSAVGNTQNNLSSKGEDMESESSLQTKSEEIAQAEAGLGVRVTEKRTDDEKFQKVDNLIELSPQEEALRDAVIDRLSQSGMEVITDTEEGQRVLNENDAKISNHVRFFRTADGEAYGFTIGGKIYIDPRIANSETPIHEYALLWAEVLRRLNPKEWANVVGLMKGTSVWEEVRKRYPELKTDDEIADEVLATYSGRGG